MFGTLSTAICFMNMNIKLESRVDTSFETVCNNFSKELFTYLLPPGAQLLKYDGSRKGDHVHLKLPLAGEWLSEIVENESSDDHVYFVDEGRILPAPLKNWRHIHHIYKDGEGARIVDDMHFSSGSKFLDGLIRPFLYISFLPRKTQYAKFFRKISTPAASGVR